MALIVGTLPSLPAVAVAAAASPPAASSPAASPTGTTLVSVAPDGSAANGWADRPEISGDGRYVTFDSSASNLVPGTTGVVRRVYRHDRVSGLTELVSLGQDGQVAGEWNSFSWPSDNGRLVAFVSDDQTLSSPPTRARSVFLRDLDLDTTEVISVNAQGQPANGASSRPMVSPDGRFVAFSSYATNLSPEGNNGQEQVFLRDRVQGTTTLVSAAVDGGPGDARSYRGMVSSDG
ncbi:hypothetical protein, partial [Nocardioides sp.]|uniref:hypothetical protein n=1 Tax=Nocardioides sp. TaxID=35761 RepID=UPI00356B2F9B